MGRPKPKQEEAKKGAPLWMATFSDLVTLLLTFFVLLLGMANFDDSAKVDAVLLSIRAALGGEGIDRALLEDSLSNASNMPKKDQEEESASEPIEARLREAMSEHISDDLMRRVHNEQEVRIRLDERVFFRPGSAVLHPSAYVVLADVGSVLAATDLGVRVEGYADGTGAEVDNWRLSAERSLAVVMALREKGPIPGDRLEIAAYGAHRSGLGAGEDESWNRRIELVVRADASNQAGEAADVLQGGPDGR